MAEPIDMSTDPEGPKIVMPESARSRIKQQFAEDEEKFIEEVNRAIQDGDETYKWRQPEFGWLRSHPDISLGALRIYRMRIAKELLRKGHVNLETLF